MTDRSDPPPTTVELIDVSGDTTDGERTLPPTSPTNRRGNALGIVALLTIGAIFVALTGGGDEPPSASSGQRDDPAAAVNRADLHSLDRLDALITAGRLPPGLVAAEVYRASPGPDTLRFLLRSLGGIEAITVATAEGSFDLVTFNPNNPDQLAASRRSGYGPAQNQNANETWTVTESGGLLTSPLAPAVEHDFAHYNDYGTLSLWTLAVDPAGTDESGSDESGSDEFGSDESDEPGDAGDFARRTVALGPIPFLDDRRSDPLHPSRYVITGDTLFALTGHPDYYSNAREFVSLIADRGEGQVVLDGGAGWAWVDSPMAGVVVAYPADESATTAVWSTETLERIDDHQLAGRSFRRLAVSGNKTTMVGVTFDGTLEVVDLGTDRVTSRFGQVDPDGIATPITLNRDGTIALAVDHDGTVTMWWVGDPEPITVIDADAGPPRTVSEYRAPRVSSAVARDAVRVAVRNRAQPGVATTWAIIDTNPARWVEVACERAGRAMTAGERVELGTDLSPPACP